MLAQSVNENSVQEATPKVASFAFPASHRLHRERDINALFAQGTNLFVFPYRATYQLMPSESNESPIRMMPIVPKRLFKHAVDRNRNKRRIREAFRLQANTLREALKNKGLQLHIAFLLTSKEEIPWQRGHASIDKILNKILRAVEKE